MFQALSLKLAESSQITKAQLTSVSEKGGPSRSYSGSISFQDIQDLQVLQGKCQSLARALSIDQQVFTRVLKQVPKGETSNQKSIGHNTSYLRSSLLEIEMEHERVTSILNRLDNNMALVRGQDISMRSNTIDFWQQTRTIVDYRCLAGLRNNSYQMTELARCSQMETNLIRQLTKKASRDTDIAKVLAFLGLIYLPAGIVSVCCILLDISE